MAFLPYAIAAIGVGMTAAGIYGQYEAEQETAETNIALAQADIEYIEKQTKTAEERFRDEGEAFKGTQKAVVGHSAAVSTEGTPLFIQQETAARIEQDVLQIRETGKHQVEQLELQKKGYEAGARVATANMILGMGSTFLTSYTKMYRPKTKMPSFGYQNKPYYGYYDSPYGF